MSGDERMVTYVRGRVQGVGFRWWTRARALEFGLVGYARNTDDGRVEICAEGERDALEDLLALLTEFPSSTRRPGRVSGVAEPMWREASGRYTGFVER